MTLTCIQAPLAESGQAVAQAAWGFVRSFGGIWGIAIPAAIFNSRINQLVTMHLTDEHLGAMLSNGGAYALAAGGLVHAITEEDPVLEGQVRGIYVDGLSLCWYVALGSSLLGFLVSAVVREVALRTDLVTKFELVKRSSHQDGRKDIENVRKVVGNNNAEKKEIDT